MGKSSWGGMFLRRSRGGRTRMLDVGCWQSRRRRRGGWWGRGNQTSLMPPTNNQLLQNVRFVCWKDRCCWQFSCFWYRSALMRWPLPPGSSNATMATTSVRHASEYQSSIRQKCWILTQTRSGLNPLLCPKCRKNITGRASDMENFLKVIFGPVKPILGYR